MPVRTTKNSVTPRRAGRPPKQVTSEPVNAEEASDKVIIKADAILGLSKFTLEKRGTQRDTPTGERSMAKTVAAFNIIHGTDLTEKQGWQFMETLKMVRSTLAHDIDDYVDAANYAALAGEASSKQ